MDTHINIPAPEEPLSEKEILDRLKTATEGEYERLRDKWAGHLGWRVGKLDAARKRLRNPTPINQKEVITNTDAGNGTRFVNRNSNDVRCCCKNSKISWFHWNGQRWEPDALGAVMELARQTARDISKQAVDDNEDGIITGEKFTEALEWSIQSMSDSRLDAMLSQAGQGTSIVVTGESFDVGEELLNLQNGTINLDTGQFYPARREDMLTQIANVNYDLVARCPRWERFVQEALQGDLETVCYLQRVTGYLLTGSQREQCFFLIMGAPGTGKSTYWRTLACVLGDYFIMVPSGLFVKKGRFHQADSEGATPALAKLVGKRVAAEVELGEGDKFASALLKRITGGDAMTARPLYQPHFTFQPQCKPVFLTNHQPGTSDFSGGLQDRLRLIKFDHVFRGKAEENKNLVDELRAEGSGILNWALAGLRDYQKNGSLGEPAVVKQNVQEYFEDENVVARWLKECTVPCKLNGKATFAQAFATFKHWAEKNEEECGTSRWFSTRMKQLGHETVPGTDNVKQYQFKLLFPEAAV